MKPNKRTIKTIFTAGLMLGFLPVLFGAPNSKAVAPSIELTKAPAPVVVPDAAFTKEDLQMMQAEKEEEVTAPPSDVVTIPLEPGYGQCAEWMNIALAAGWAKEEWATVDRVMFRESRCLPGAFNDTDPNGGSWGLMQINGFWCKPNRWTKQGFLQDRGVLSSCDELFDPYVNVTAALAIWMYGEEQHGCGWKGPWLISCKK